MEEINARRFSKSDLVWIIEYMRHKMPGGDISYSQAVQKLEDQREEEKEEAIDKALSAAIEANREYASILAPYDGSRIIDIPDDVLKTAAAMQKRYEAAMKTCTRLSAVRKRGGPERLQ